MSFIQYLTPNRIQSLFGYPKAILVPYCQFCLVEQIATHAAETDGEGFRADASAAPMEFDAATVPGTQGGTPTPDELQKQSSDTDAGQEAGQLEADGEAEVEAGIIDGETDADVDLDAVG